MLQQASLERKPRMRTERITIPTDTIPLDGTFYEPDSGATAGAVLLFRGNTMNFYVGAPRFPSAGAHRARVDKGCATARERGRRSHDPRTAPRRAWP